MYYVKWYSVSAARPDLGLILMDRQKQKKKFNHINNKYACRIK